jgi:hypothetical protein
LQEVPFGEAQIYKNIAVLPLIACAGGTFQYRTLATWDVAITEVFANGSVPGLMVVERGNKPVLLIDGEDLAGTKQYRVVNTSILLKEASETKMLASGRKQGKWSYSSKAFSKSGTSWLTRPGPASAPWRHPVLPFRPGRSLGWHCRTPCQCLRPIPTSALNDFFNARENDLRQRDEIFKSVPNQIGLLVHIGGAPARPRFIRAICAPLLHHARMASL